MISSANPIYSFIPIPLLPGLNLLLIPIPLLPGLNFSHPNYSPIPFFLVPLGLAAGHSCDTSEPASLAGLNCHDCPAPWSREGRH